MKDAKTPKNLVTEYPPLRVRDICAPGIAGGLFKAFYGKEAALFYFGRGALWHALKALHLSGSDTVLVPAYHCGVEIEAVAMTGARLRFYGVDEHLDVDAASLPPLIDRSTKALLLIHYFGFPQPVQEIRDLCDSRGVTLIEDCSHALFSSLRERALGSFGDLSVFSQRKMLPLPDGGALLVNNQALAPRLPLEPPSGAIALKKTLGMLFRSLFRCSPYHELPYPLELLARGISRKVAGNSGTSYSTGMEVSEQRCSLAISRISRLIMDRTDAEEVIRRRRENYSLLLQNLAGSPLVESVKDTLPEGVCPLFFPVRLDQVSRSEVQQRLRRLGFGAFVFGEELHPALPREIFKEAELLSQKILCLPVHQTLNREEITSMAAALLQTVGEARHCP